MTSSGNGQEETISLIGYSSGPIFLFSTIIFYYNTTTTSTTRTTNLPLHYNRPNANRFLNQKFLNTPAIMH